MAAMLLLAALAIPVPQSSPLEGDAVLPAKSNATGPTPMSHHGVVISCPR